MHTYFISDLHLSPEHPEIVLALFDFLDNQAPEAEALYIIGDLFEYWIGDDAADLLGAGPVLQKMQRIAAQIPCYFIAGNRDFLVGKDFAEQTGFTILPDATVIDLYGTPTLILHGDSLCIEDHAHQKFRQEIVTNQAWRDEFLSVTVPERIEMAKQARMESNQHKSKISMQIMDVTKSAVIAAFEQNAVSQMIHGHTHRQAVHHYQLKQGKGTRYVLGDWGKTSSVLRADEREIKIVNKAIRRSWLSLLLAAWQKVSPGKKPPRL